MGRHQPDHGQIQEGASVVSLTDLSDVLWRERELLEVLLFKLEEEQLLLVSGRSRWLARATREVEVVVAEVRAVELRRAVLTDGVAAVLRLPGDATLAAVADAAAAPYDQILRDHRAALLTLTHEVSAVADGNKSLLSSGYRAAREALLAVDRDEGSYTASGRPALAAAHSRLVDEAV